MMPWQRRDMQGRPCSITIGSCRGRHACGRLAAACPGRLGVWRLVPGHQASVLWLCWQHPV